MDESLGSRPERKQDGELGAMLREGIAVLRMAGGNWRNRETWGAKVPGDEEGVPERPRRELPLPWDRTSLPPRAPSPPAHGRWDDGNVCGRAADASTRRAVGINVTVRTLPACVKCIVGKLPNVNKRGGVARRTDRPMPRLSASVARTVVGKVRRAAPLPRHRAWSRSEKILGISVTVRAVTSRGEHPPEHRRAIAGTLAGTRCVACGTEKASGYGGGGVGHTPGAESTVRDGGRRAAA